MRNTRIVLTALGGLPIDYRTEDFVQRAARVDAVFDPISGVIGCDRIARSARADGLSVMECRRPSKAGAEI